MPRAVRETLDSGRPLDEILGALMPVLSEALSCERCALFLREPETKRISMTHCWYARPEFALELDGKWRREPASLAVDDPMFGEALRNPTALFIEDVANADPSLVNIAYELKHFGHSALIHAPLYHEGRLYGILEPCVFGGARRWSDDDRALIAYAQKKIAPLAADYVGRHCPN